VNRKPPPLTYWKRYVQFSAKEGNHVKNTALGRIGLQVSRIAFGTWPVAGLSPESV
jgi:hypothetical protein